jgi:hypothetical protein
VIQTLVYKWNTQDKNVTHLKQQCLHCKLEYTILVDTDKYRDWVNGELCQNVWPHFNAGQREQIISGMHPECWEELFGMFDQDDEDDVPSNVRWGYVD